MTASSTERRALADQLAAGGPQAPTLCSGWLARDLAAHLVLRESRPDVALGLVVPLLAGRSERVRVRTAGRPFEQLVAAFAAGPPRLSPFAVPGLDAVVNLGEHFVHCEDLRRAGDDAGAGAGAAAPRELPREVQEGLWRTMLPRARMLYRRAPVGVELVSTLGPRQVVRRADGDQPSVVVTGEPGELLLHSFGRTAVARVDVEGPPEAVRAFDAVRRAV